MVFNGQPGGYYRQPFTFILMISLEVSRYFVKSRKIIDFIAIMEIDIIDL